MPVTSPHLAGPGAREAGDTARTAALCGLLAAGAAAVTHVVGPPPVDAPAHAFQTLAFARHGFALWDNYWYAGYYQYVLYSVLYYPVAVVAGIFPVAVVSVALSAWAFASATGRRWGCRRFGNHGRASVFATCVLAAVGGAGSFFGSVVAATRRASSKPLDHWSGGS